MSRSTLNTQSSMTVLRASRSYIVLLLLIAHFPVRSANAQSGFLRCAQTARIQSILDAGRQPAVIGKSIFSLETAITPAELERGLMERDHLESGSGMIFVYQNPQLLSFWMGHCLIDLDILFLDDRRRIVSMHTMKAQPPQAPGESDAAYSARMPRYSSGRFAQYAIELPAGSIESIGVRRGDSVRFHIHE